MAVTFRRFISTSGHMREVTGSTTHYPDEYVPVADVHALLPAEEPAEAPEETEETQDTESEGDADASGQ